MSRLHNAWLNEETDEVHTPKARMVWPWVLEPRVNVKFPDQPPKFMITLLLPKGANIDAITAELARAAELEHGKDWRKKVKSEKFPLKKTADNESLQEFSDDFPHYLNATANERFPPFVYGQNAKLFAGKSDEIYSGRWCVVAGKGWGYTKGSNGVGFNLNRIQLLDQDEVIAGGRVATSSGFVPFEDTAIGAVSKPTTTDDLLGGDDIQF